MQRRPQLGVGCAGEGEEEVVAKRAGKQMNLLGNERDVLGHPRVGNRGGVHCIEVNGAGRGTSSQGEVDAV